MRQRVDADAELADAFGLFEQLAIDAARAQHQRGGEASDAASDDDCFHQLDSSSTRRSFFTSPAKGEGDDGASLPSGLFGCKRLCCLGFQLGAGFRLTLNFEVLEILPVTHAVAEDLFLAG